MAAPEYGARLAAALVPRERAHSLPSARAVTFRPPESATRRWVPPEGLRPDHVLRVIDAATPESDPLLPLVLRSTGAHLSETLALRPMDIERNALVLPSGKHTRLTGCWVFLPEGQADLPGALWLWAREQGLRDRAPVFFSRKRGPDGQRDAITRQHAWRMCKAASARADLPVLAARDSAAAQPGWPRRHLAYLTVGDEAAGGAVRSPQTGLHPLDRPVRASSGYMTGPMTSHR